MANSPKAKRLFLVFLVVVAFFYAYVSYDYIRVSMNDRKLEDYALYVVEMAGDQHRSSKDVRDLILMKAEEFGLPLRDEQITITGSGVSLKVSYSYGVDIDVPLLQRILYRKSFQHDLEFHQR